MEEKIKFAYQVCQDEQTDKDFKELHREIVNKIIKFCKEHNLIIDEFYINCDCLTHSIDQGNWVAGTDSSFSMYKFDEEHPNMKFDPKPILWSI